MSDLESLIRGDEETRRELAERGGEMTLWQGPAAAVVAEPAGIVGFTFDDKELTDALMAIDQLGDPSGDGADVCEDAEPEHATIHLGPGELGDLLLDDSLPAMDLDPEASVLMPAGWDLDDKRSDAGGVEDIGELMLGAPPKAATGSMVSLLTTEIALKAGAEVPYSNLLVELAATTTDSDIIEALIVRQDLTLEVINAFWQNQFFNTDKYQDANRAYLSERYGNPIVDLEILVRSMNLLQDDEIIDVLKRRCEQNTKDVYFSLSEGGTLFYLDEKGMLHMKLLSFDVILEPGADLRIMAKNLQQTILRTDSWLLPGLVRVVQKLEIELVNM